MLAKHVKVGDTVEGKKVAQVDIFDLTDQGKNGPPLYRITVKGAKYLFFSWEEVILKNGVI